MRKIIFFIMFIMAGMLYCQIPRGISYQGILKDNDGIPVASDIYTITFRIYDNEHSSESIWEETQTINIEEGILSAIIGSNTILNLPFNRQYWLGITIDTDGVELVPRIKLTASPYSLNAQSVMDSSITTSKIANGAVTQEKLASGIHLPVSGTAGGDLAGSYPDPVIADTSITTSKIADGAVTQEKLASDVVLLPGGSAGGDLAGTYPNPVVTGLEGHDVSDLDPGNGDVLKWNGTAWTPSPDELVGTPSGQAGGDLTGSYPDPQIANNSITNEHIAGNQVVKSLNGLKDNLYLTEGSNITISETNDSTLEIAATVSVIGNTLDQAYDQGGAGNGRIIQADNGPVLIQGTDGLRVESDNGVLFSGTFDNGTIPGEGAGVRMMWFPAKSAFRAGEVDGYQWDSDSIGIHSTAFGNNVKASGAASFASGNYSMALGDYSLAAGDNAIASSLSSVALGYQANASGDYCTAIGYQTSAGGAYATALGYRTATSGQYSTALGYRTEARNNFSTALGSYVRVVGRGSLGIGDQSTAAMLLNSQQNSFAARFSGGYQFYTNPAMSVGARLLPNANAWSTISDSTKKENFKVVDGEYVLSKISEFTLTSWNYKGQDPLYNRHYGPMAQDLYNAFGYDGIGIIGNDTTINSSDFSGINFIAIQALEKRTEQLNDKIQLLERENELLRKEIARMKYSVVINENNNLEIIQMKAILRQLLNKIDDIENKNGDVLKPVKNTVNNE